MSRRSPPVVAFAILCVCLAQAEDRRPLRTARSENERFALRIRPGRQGRNDSNRPRAVLFEHVGGHGRRIWRSRLVNDIAPRHVAIRNDGRFLVTLDEFRRGGAAHAVVVYDDRGKHVREFGLRELLRGDDWKHVKAERRAVVWLDGASWRFLEKAPAFVIRLKWGREIRIDLAKLTDPANRQHTTPTTQPAMTDARQPASAPANVIPPEILALLEQPTSAPAEATSREAITQAIENLHHLAALAEIEIEPAGATTDDSAADSVPLSNVPLPDPAHPVDYVAWMLEQTATDDGRAAELYKSACDSYVSWDGGQELFDRAMAGDPDALASPEIAAWLEQNSAALAAFRAAPNYEFRGMIKPSEDGSVVAVLLPQLGAQRRLARAAIIQAKQLETAGDTDAAFDIYADNFAIGEQISQGPTLIENLVGMATQAATAYSVLDSLAAGDDDADYVEIARKLEESYAPTRPIAEALGGERAMIFDALQRTYDYDADSGEYFVDAFQAQFEFSIVASLAEGPRLPRARALPFLLGAVDFESAVPHTNEYYDKLVSAATKPYPQAMASLAQLEREASEPEFIMRNPYVGVLLPSLTRSVHLETRNEATRRAVILAANLKAYRQTHGEYPPSLEALGDRETTIDPFTGDRFVYRRDGDGFTLYSLGGNGVDDGGVHDRSADNGDFVFLPRP